MKKNFSQPLDPKPTVIHFLIEMGRDAFVHFDDPDKSDIDYYNGLSLEIDASKDRTSQLVEFLYENGFSLNNYRELVHETKVGFSFIGNTPGYTQDEICLHVHADQINEPEYKDKTSHLTLEETLDRFEKSPDLRRVVALSLAQLFNERETVNAHQEY